MYPGSTCQDRIKEKRTVMQEVTNPMNQNDSSMTSKLLLLNKFFLHGSRKKMLHETMTMYIMMKEIKDDFVLTGLSGAVTLSQSVNQFPFF